MFFNQGIKLGLGKLRVVAFVVSVAAVTYHVHEDIGINPGGSGWRSPRT